MEPNSTKNVRWTAWRQQRLKDQLHGVGARSLLHRQQPYRIRPPAGMTVKRLEDYLYGNALKDMPRAHFEWLTEMAQLPLWNIYPPYKPYKSRLPALAVTPSMFLYDTRGMYRLAGKKFRPRDFMVKGNAAGHVVPARALAGFLNRRPGLQDEIKTMITGTRGISEHFETGHHILTHENGVAVVCVGVQKAEVRLLTIVSPDLYRKFRAARTTPRQVYKTPPASQGNSFTLPLRNKSVKQAFPSDRE